MLLGIIEYNSFDLPLLVLAHYLALFFSLKLLSFTNPFYKHRIINNMSNYIIRTFF